MEFTELVNRRESVRSYDPARQVDEAVLRRILDAGIIAPTAANKQPFRFVVCSTPEALSKVRPCYKGRWIDSAPVVLAVVGLTDRAWMRRDGYNAVETDCTIAMDHMILAAENEGVGTCWIAAFDNGVLRAGLGLNENEKVFAITPLGYPPAGYRRRDAAVRKKIEEIVEFR
jgi:nitroreductase